MSPTTHEDEGLRQFLEGGKAPMSPTGYEVDMYRAVPRIAKALERIADSLAGIEAALDEVPKKRDLLDHAESVHDSLVDVRDAVRAFGS